MKNIEASHVYTIILRGLAGITLSLCLIFTSVNFAHALWIGQSQINPFLELRGTYETNIFRDNQEEDSDFITVVSPGIHLEFPYTQDATFKAVANYRADIKIYGNDGDSEIDPNGELNTVAHRLDGHLLFNFASGVRFKTGYILNIASSTPDFREDTRDEYTDHKFLVQTSYRFADLYEIQLQYDGAFRQYDKTEDDDSIRHTGEATMYYRIFPTMSLLAGGSYGIIDREEPNFIDSVEYTGFGGFRYEATESMSGIFKVGALYKDFDSELDSVTEIYASGQLNATFSETTRLSLGLSRNIGETSLTDESDIYGAYYVITNFDSKVTYSLTALPNLSMIGKFSYSHESYPEDTGDRSDDTLEIGAGLDYKFPKYLIIGAEYEYATTDSSVNTNDFTDHTMMMKIRATL